MEHFKMIEGKDGVYLFLSSPRGYGEKTFLMKKTCREEVRQVPRCSDCALCRQCENKPFETMPRMAFYLYNLKYVTLPQIKTNLANKGFASLRLVSKPSTSGEMAQGAYATIRVYRKHGGLTLLFKLLLQGTEDAESIENRLHNAYAIYKKGLYEKQKAKTNEKPLR